MWGVCGGLTHQGVVCEGCVMCVCGGGGGLTHQGVVGTVEHHRR